MPRNMQKRNKKVVSLQLEDEPLIEEDQESEEDSPQPLDEEALYQHALGQLRRGIDQKSTARSLVGKGMSHREASKLTEKVWQENQHTRRENGFILLGFAGVLLIIGGFILVSQIRDSESLLLSPAYAFFATAAWFGYKGYSEYRSR